MRFIICLGLLVGIFSCKQQPHVPDVSNIKINLTTYRFEKDLFALDSLHMGEGISQLQKNHPIFSNIFFAHIINVDPRWSSQQLNDYTYGFIRSHQFVADTVARVFKNFEPYEKELEKGLQFVKYYFPKYPIPVKVITYIGPLDGYGDILDEDALIVGLQHHIGAAFSGYEMPWVRQTYPAYISNRFTPATISVNAFKNIVLDMYPEKSEDKSLLIQMVEKGKRLYLLKRFLPHTHDYLLMGYTQKQYDEAMAHEKVIWDLFVQNNFLQTIDFNIIKNYIGESPKTQALGESSPGNIGSFAGWQIVKKYMQKFPETTVTNLMNMNAETLFEKAKYKP